MSSKGSLNNRFQDYGAAPHSGAWQSINEILLKKKKRKAIIWWTFGSTGIAAALILSLLYFSPFTNESKQNTALHQTSNMEGENTIEKGQEKTFTSPVESNVAQKRKKEVSNDNNTIIQQSNQIQPNKVNKVNVKAPISQTPTSLALKPTGEETSLKKTTAIAPKINAPALLANHENNIIERKGKPFKIEKILAQKVKLIEVEYPEIRRQEVTVKALKIKPWEWGVQLASSQSTNLNYFEQSIANMLTDYSNPGNNNESVLPVQNEQIYFVKVNRPVALSFLIKMQMSKRFYLKASPQVTLLKGVSYVKSYSENLDQFFYSAGTTLDLGFYVLQKKRWKIDLETGVTFEKMLFTSSFNTEKVPIQFWGSQVGLGVNYHLTEKTKLRIGTSYDWKFGENNKTIVHQFQSLKNLGIGVSAIQQF